MHYSKSLCSHQKVHNCRDVTLGRCSGSLLNKQPITRQKAQLWHCQFPSFGPVISLCKMLPLGEAGGRALGTSLYYFCNALWVCNYFKRKCENKKKMHCRWWLQPWNRQMLAPWKKSNDKPRQHIERQRHYFASKGAYSQSYDFSSSHEWMWELDHKESWALKN